MDIITALSISIGLFGGIATWLFLGPIGGLGLSIWAAFIAWASFYHCGGKEAGLQKAIVNNVFGAIDRLGPRCIAGHADRHSPIPLVCLYGPASALRLPCSYWSSLRKCRC